LFNEKEARRSKLRQLAHDVNDLIARRERIRRIADSKDRQNAFLSGAEKSNERPNLRDNLIC